MMKQPKQMEPVSLDLHRFSAVPMSANVRAAGWLDILKHVGRGALHGAIGSITGGA